MSVRKRLSRTASRVVGWTMRVECELPPSGVIVGAPHTSMGDWVAMIALLAEAGIKARWLGKSSLFWFPLGPILRAWGGIPVDRASAHGMVGQMTDYLHDHPDSYVALTPEGTRSVVEYWKSGFYRIALAAQVPLILGYIDGVNKVAAITEVYYPTGNVSEDMDVIRAYYRGIEGIKPGQTSIPRLREEDTGVI